MNKKTKNTWLYFVCLIYMMSRVLLIFPGDVDKKSKRQIYQQSRFVSILNESRNLTIVIREAYRVPVSYRDESLQESQFQFLVQEPAHPRCPGYTGNKIFATPGEPDDDLFS